MAEGLEALAKMEYPGRFIIMGRSPHNDAVVVYGITGRSPSSQARRLVEDREHGVVRTEVTDPQQLNNGNPALLVYPALAFGEGSLVVSNGAQTNLLYSAMVNTPEVNRIPIAVLNRALLNPSFLYDPKLGWIDVTSFEPDSSHTPRISGCVTNNSMLMHNAYCDISGKANKTLHRVDTRCGKGSLLSTYNGVNTNPLPSFQGSSRDVTIEHASANDLAHAVYEALAPRNGKNDLRVSVAAVYLHGKERDVQVLNRHDIRM